MNEPFTKTGPHNEWTPHNMMQQELSTSLRSITYVYYDTELKIKFNKTFPFRYVFLYCN